MRTMRAMLLGAAMLSGSAAFAGAQVMLPMQRYQDYDDRRAFGDGYKHGMSDARHGKQADLRCDRYREADDLRAYREGYIKGFREVRGEWREEWNGGYRDHDHDRDDRYRDRAYMADLARRVGRSDGFNAGLNDRRTGHSYRPTHDRNYKHADNGYEWRFGNKNDYKAFYREGFVNGYQDGYNNGPWKRR